MGTTSDLRPGAVINFNGELHIILESEHRTPGNLRAFYQVKMRNMKTGRLSEYRFRSGESIEFVYLDRKPFQFLYRDGNTFYFMDLETYEQIPIDIELIGESVIFLTENQEVQIAFVGDNPIAVELPTHLNLLVVQTEPGVRGDTATNVLKPAVVESGATVQVPIFIDEGDIIRIDTRTGEYVERVNK